MGKLLQLISKIEHLDRAWTRIRENGRASVSQDTRAAIEHFSQKSRSNLTKIQRQLRSDAFKFSPQIGVVKRKSSGGYRGIVMASVENRVVERAILDGLQEKSKFVRSVLLHPNSVGGVPDRSVAHGIKIVRDALNNGARYFVRSDISSFFDGIPRKWVLDRIATDLNDEEFLELLDRASTVTLANEHRLGEKRRAFPTNAEGVAQGSPLSPLFGNILLYDFDNAMNRDGVTCVRFIDDFVLLSNSERKVEKAFASARKRLIDFGLTCHDPYESAVSSEKAAQGPVTKGIEFLGYRIEPGLIQPGRVPRRKLITAVEGELFFARSAITSILSTNSGTSGRVYAQAVSHVDKIVKGWGAAFSYGNNDQILDQVDREITAAMRRFSQWYTAQSKGVNWKTKRRAMGVALLSDLERKSLDELPFRLDPSRPRFLKAKATMISTDGSLIPIEKRDETGCGGWAFVVHGAGVEQCGHRENVTNNQMELLAVVEAIKAHPQVRYLHIRTDSRYVEAAINKRAVISKNVLLWREFEALSRSHVLKVEWVQAHAGDKHNERADHLANAAARRLRNAIP